MNAAKDKPKIAIVNSRSFGEHFPEHLARLERFAEVIRFHVPSTVSEDELIERLEGVDGIIASVTPRFTEKVLANLPQLRILARHGIGCDNVDLQAAKKLNIPVSRVQGHLERESVAEHSVALLLAVSRFLTPAYVSLCQGKWQERARFAGGLELKGKRIGLIGIGNIGSRVAEILRHGFQAEVVAYDPYVEEKVIRERCAEPVSFDQLLSTSHVISFQCPLTEETTDMLSREALTRVMPGVLIVNTCRGEMVDEEALIEALKAGTVFGYGTDVITGEPIGADHPMLHTPNALVVPHLGGHSMESQRSMGETAVSDMELVLLENKAPGMLAY